MSAWRTGALLLLAAASAERSAVRACELRLYACDIAELADLYDRGYFKVLEVISANIRSF